MKHVDMRKLSAAAQEERRRQVVGLRESGLTYDAIAAQVGLTRTGVFNICRRFAEQGRAGLASRPRGPAPGKRRFLAPQQQARTQTHRHQPHAPADKAARTDPQLLRASAIPLCRVVQVLPSRINKSAEYGSD
jgi:transposase